MRQYTKAYYSACHEIRYFEEWETKDFFKKLS
jgi:hypothetical protein